MTDSYIVDEQLRWHYSSRRDVSDAGQVGIFSTYEMTSYVMQRQGIAAVVRPVVMQPCARAYGVACVPLPLYPPPLSLQA